MTAYEKRLSLWQGKIQTEIEIEGSGPPVVFLHGPWGLRPDREFVSLLAQSHTVYAPKHPGTSDGDHESIHQLDNWWDLIVYYGELFDRLELAAPAIVGHSFGGMLASEIAATLPNRVGKLALLAPLGLWRDDLPVKNWMIFTDAERAKALFADPAGAAAQAFAALPEAPEARIAAQVDFIWAQACTGKFVWPLPDTGLKKHIHRIAAPSLVLWGESDGVIAPAYAQEFGHRLASARVELVDHAAHMLHLEQAETTAQLVRSFLAP